MRQACSDETRGCAVCGRDGSEYPRGRETQGESVCPPCDRWAATIAWLWATHPLRLVAVIH